VSLPKPADEVLAAADHGRIRELTDHAHDLWTTHEGKIPRAAWDPLWAEALRAAGGHKELLEGVWRLRPEGVT